MKSYLAANSKVIIHNQPKGESIRLMAQLADAGIVIKSTTQEGPMTRIYFGQPSEQYSQEVKTQMNRDLHNGKWIKRIGVQIERKTVVIIGFGHIGKKVADLLRPFNVRIIAVDPNINEVVEGIEILPLDKALREADIITIHASGKDQIVGKNEFELMKKGVYLLNVARGSMVDEASLVRALEEGKVSKKFSNVEDFLSDLKK